MDRLGEFWGLFMDYSGDPRGHIGRAGASSCSNRRPECVDGRGWCDGDSKVCNGFFPKAAVWKES